MMSSFRSGKKSIRFKKIERTKDRKTDDDNNIDFVDKVICGCDNFDARDVFFYVAINAEMMTTMTSVGNADVVFKSETNP